MLKGLNTEAITLAPDSIMFLKKSSFLFFSSHTQILTTFQENMEI